ncbi:MULTISPECIES: HU family DNA-binding protein [Roseobacteraceae]|uniref:DNA-binding protein HU n=1 Tax=Pseudosulfitobacter pseudonitzschiae TaxID=1402135 RepID=A0A221JZ48_9RHOB|nr:MULTISPECIES: HU family DNA-binding protein [Roseobacteraceae]ASM72009.1 DNA-binding protein HU [Pseudosulfitobacter pseudonitzschiae]
MATSKTTPIPVKSAADTAAAATKAATATTAAHATKAAAATPGASGGAEMIAPGPMMRKKELIDAVVAASGAKKKDAKPVVEAMLKVMGNALRDGRELNLHPFGSVKVRREKDMVKARVLTTKIRQRKPEAIAAANAEAAAAAEAAESVSE